jgi:small subunit ribosomal protein S11
MKRSKDKGEGDGKVYAHLSYNNAILTLTCPLGRTLFSSSAGEVSFKGSRRSTAFAGKQVGLDIGLKARKRGLRKVDLILRGMGKGRFTVAKGLRAGGLKVRTIYEETSFSHNGCRPPKKRRL